jgi:type III secretory pathway component EscR
MEETQLLPKKRSTFITVLCILTFVGSGYGIFSGILNIATSSTLEQTGEIVSESMDDALEQIEDEDNLSENQKQLFESFFNSVSESLTPGKIRNSAIVNILSCLITLFGAFMMWNLNKKGFYIYVAGIVIAILGMVFVFGGIMGAITAASSGFWGVVMIILYGVNLKDMN